MLTIALLLSLDGIICNGHTQPMCTIAPWPLRIYAQRFTLPITSHPSYINSGYNAIDSTSDFRASCLINRQLKLPVEPFRLFYALYHAPKLPDHSVGGRDGLEPQQPHNAHEDRLAVPNIRRE